MTLVHGPRGKGRVRSSTRRGTRAATSADPGTSSALSQSGIDVLYSIDIFKRSFNVNIFNKVIIILGIFMAISLSFKEIMKLP